MPNYSCKNNSLSKNLPIVPKKNSKNLSGKNPKLEHVELWKYFFFFKKMKLLEKKKVVKNKRLWVMFFANCYDAFDVRIKL